MGMICTDMCANCHELGCTNSSLLEEDAPFEENTPTSESDMSQTNQDNELGYEQTQIVASSSEIEIPLDQDADLSISSVFYESIAMF